MNFDKKTASPEKSLNPCLQSFHALIIIKKTFQRTRMGFLTLQSAGTCKHTQYLEAVDRIKSIEKKKPTLIRDILSNPLMLIFGSSVCFA